MYIHLTNLNCAQYWGGEAFDSEINPVLVCFLWYLKWSYTVTVDGSEFEVQLLRSNKLHSLKINLKVLIYEL